MLSVWWDWKGIIFFELLPNNRTINSDVYFRQLDELDAAIKRKRPELVNRKGVVFHHGNARPHTSLVTRQKFLQLRWDVLPPPQYSPDFALSDYYLFRTRQNSLNGINVDSIEGIKNHLLRIFATREILFNYLICDWIQIFHQLLLTVSNPRSTHAEIKILFTFYFDSGSSGIECYPPRYDTLRRPYG